MKLFKKRNEAFLNEMKPFSSKKMEFGWWGIFR